MFQLVYSGHGHNSSSCQTFQLFTSPTPTINSPACQDTLEVHMATFQVLASTPEYPISPLLTPPLSTPYLCKLLIQKAYWRSAGTVSWIPLDRVKMIYLMFEHDILQHVIMSKDQEMIMDHLSSTLWVTCDPSIMPSLHTVCMDLMLNTLTVAGSRQWWESPICVLQKAWVEVLEVCNIHTGTTLKHSKKGHSAISAREKGQYRLSAQQERS